MKRIHRVNWENTEGIGGLRIKELLAETVWESISILFLLFAAVFMLSVLSFHIEMETGDSMLLIFIVCFTVLFYETGVRYVLSRIEKKKPRRVLHLLFTFIPALLVFLSLRLYYMAREEEIRQGLAAAATYFLKPYNRIFGANIVLKNYDQDYISMGLLFVMLVIFFALYFLSRLGRRKWLFVLVPLASTSLLMYVGLTPEWIHILFTLVGVYMTRRRGWGSGWFVSAFASVALFTIIITASGILFTSSAERLLEYSSDVKDFQSRLERSIETVFSRILLSDDKKLDNSSPRYKDVKIMTVNIKNYPKGNLYFKDFYGIDYDDGTWDTPNSAFLSACSDNGTDPEDAAMYLVSSLYKNRVFGRSDYSIEYMGLIGQAMHLPYGADVGSISGLSFKGDSVPKKDMTRKKLSFTGINTNTFTSDALLIGMKSVILKYDDDEKDFWEWYEEYVNDNCLFVPSYIFKTRAYKQVSEYRRHRISEEDNWRYEMVGVVKSYLAENYSYSWNLDGLDSDEDPLEYFLKRGKKGYCMHFASAGVILLRSLGVPARYASGYVLKPYMFSKQDDGSYEATVLDRNAHAWVEVYFSNIGWVPFEMTPGYQSDTREFPASKEAQEEREEKEKEKEQPTPTPTEVPKKDTPTPVATKAPKATGTPKPTSSVTKAPKTTPKASVTPGGSRQGNGEDTKDGSAGGNAGKIMLVFAVIFMLAGLVLFIMRLRKKSAGRLEAAVKNKYYRAAVKLMNRRVYRKLKRKGGIKGRNATDQRLEEALLKTLGEDKKNEIEEYMRVVKKAAFSQNPISGKENEAVARLYRLI